LSSFASGRLPDALRDGSLIQRTNSDNSVLEGTDGNDILYGTSNHYLLKAGAGDDYLEAVSGKGWLIGGAGTDILVDDTGGNELTGGTGTDQFWIERWADPTATTTITDFKVGEDQIKVGRLGATFDQLTFQEDECGTLIRDQGQEIAKLFGVQSTQLTAKDFVFGDPALATQLQATLEREQQSFGSPGATTAVVAPDGFTWKGASGVSDLSTQTPMQSDDIMGIGSTTKAFTGATALKLQEQGVLSLDDTLGKWAPDIAQNIPDGTNITLRQLLNGTSGIADFTQTPEFQAVIQNPSQNRTPEDVVSFIYGKSRSEQWVNPTTGILITGLAIERATGQSLEQVMREEVLNPLGLNHTFYDGIDAVIGNRARGYQDVLAADGSPNQSGALSDHLTDIDRSVFGGSGALLSTAQDLAQFSQSLFSGKLLSSESLQELLNFVPVAPTVGWGLGIERGETPWGDYWGRGGNDGSFTSQVSYLPNQGMTTSTLFNRDYSLGNSPQTAPTAQNLNVAEFRDVLGEPPKTAQT
jgi:D-alanyl-D-alanine carboxypeptidase